MRTGVPSMTGAGGACLSVVLVAIFTERFELSCDALEAVSCQANRQAAVQKVDELGVESQAARSVGTAPQASSLGFG